VKPWLDEGTLRKFANGTPSVFAEEWKSIIGDENLPKYLAGSQDWTPPAGGNVKKHLAAKNIKIDKHTISRRGDHSIDVSAKKGQTISFQVMIKRSDITASILLKKGDKKETVITKKVDSDSSPFILTAPAPEDGEYILYLDNTDSPMMGRKVKTVFWVKDPYVPKPKEEEKESKEEKGENGEKKKKEKKSSSKSLKSPKGSSVKSPRKDKKTEGV